MADSAQFTVKLTDKISGPARKMRNSLKRLGGGLKNVFGRKQTKLVRQSGKEFDRAGKTFRSSARKLGDARGKFVRERGRFSKLLGRGKDKGGGGGGGLGIGGLVAGNLATQGVNAVGRMAVGIGVAAGEMVMFGEQSRLAFGRLAKHGASGENLFTHIRELSQEFGLDLVDTTKQYQKFLALQFDPDQADTMLKLGADLRVLGTNAEQVKGVFIALGQIKSKNKLQGEERMQLAERGISGQLLNEELGKILGTDTEGVLKLQAAGKIDADTAFEAIEKALNRKLGGGKTGEAGKQFVDTTISGMIGRMKAGAQNLALTLSDSLGPSLNRIANKLSKKLFAFLESPEGKEFIKGLGKDIESIGKALEKALPFALSFTSAFGTGFSESLKEMKAAFEPLIEALGGTDAEKADRIVRGIGKGLGQIAAFGLVVSGVFLLLAGSSIIFASAMKDALFGAAKAIIKSLGDSILQVTNWWANLNAEWDKQGQGLIAKSITIGTRLMQGLAIGINTALTLPVNAALGAATAIADAFRGQLGIKSPSTVFAEMGMQSAEGFAIGMASGMADPMNMDLSPEVNQMASAAGIASPNIDAGGGGGGLSVVIGDINVDVGGAGISDSPHEQGAIIATQIRREVENLIDDMVERSGSAA